MIRDRRKRAVDADAEESPIPPFGRDLLRVIDDDNGLPSAAADTADRHHAGSIVRATARVETPGLAGLRPSNPTSSSVRPALAAVSGGRDRSSIGACIRAGKRAMGAAVRLPPVRARTTRPESSTVPAHQPRELADSKAPARQSYRRMASRSRSGDDRPATQEPRSHSLVRGKGSNRATELW
jgi:hypothetical protein